jgi:peptidoglycan/LPS O-acetylase OafA/YrhL
VSKKKTKTKPHTAINRVVLFHVAWHAAMWLPRERFTQWFSHEVPQFFPAGLNGVDWFFVLTGFLLAQPIFSGARTGTWFEFVWLRLSRIYPMYIFALLLFCVVMQKFDSIPILTWEEHSTSILKPLIDEGHPTGDSPGLPTLCSLSWANLLFINNFIPFGGCCGWTWSLAIQVHFIVIFPLVLRWFGMRKRFLFLCAFSTAAWALSRYLILVYLVQRYPIDPPSLYIYSYDFIEQFFVLFNVWYSSTFQRIGCCFAGVLLAWVQVFKPKWSVAIKDSLFLSLIALASALYCLYYSTGILFQHTWTAFFFSVGGFGHVWAIGAILFLLINEAPPVKFLSKILSQKFFTHAAYPSYCVYLIHSFMITWLFRTDYLRPTIEWDNTIFYQHAVVVLSVVYPIAYLATRFIEEPIKGLMRDYIDPKPLPKEQIKND